MTADSKVLKAVEDSVALLNEHLRLGQTVYGVNTGVGTSADTRTKHLHLLQKSLIQHQNVGILTAADKGVEGDPNAPYASAFGRHAMPFTIVRAMMLIRCNSLLRGHSGVRVSVVESIISLIAQDLTPVLPLRGSISASGDLMPLSYVAGLLEGNKDIFVRSGLSRGSSLSSTEIVTSYQALKLAGLQAFSFEPKEALGLLNGTAASCAAASLAIYQVRHQAVLAQVLSAMATEALLGSIHNHDPFISLCRPHTGQTEAAAAIFSFLTGSRLVPDRDPTRIGLFQDRYPLRTASQWIGPQLEDLTLATQQIQTELNSTTDNPLIDVATNLIHHGGNFQAVSLTSAMEKALNAVQMLGRLTFAQCSELLNSTLNKGLPPNLCVDDPSLSFTFKGVDINMAAYMSELAHLAHPVGPNVQSAEMHNQAVNSLALLAARSVSDASDVLALMGANYLYALCQALDLRCLHFEFAAAAEPKVASLFEEIFASLFEKDSCKVEELHRELWPLILEQWLNTSSLDLGERGSTLAKKILGSLMTSLRSRLDDGSAGMAQAFAKLCDFQAQLSVVLVTVYAEVRTSFLDYPTTSSYLGLASRAMYKFVRNDLGLPIHRGLIDHPTVNIEECNTDLAPSNPTDSQRERFTIGSRISKIYEALRSDAIHVAVMGIVEKVEQNKQEGKELVGSQ